MKLNPDEILSEPSDIDIEFARQLDDDVVVLGAGGKMGPTLVALLAKSCQRSNPKVRIFAVSRFSAGIPSILKHQPRVVTIKADLTDAALVENLPQPANAIWMAGRKFSEGDGERRYAEINSAAPLRISQRFKDSRFVVFSSGNVYPFSSPQTAPTESTPPAPVGPYAESVLRREKAFSESEALLLRLNYAIDLRYGVIHDVVTRILNSEPIDLTVPMVNVIWQRDANSIAIRSLEQATNPPSILNVTGPDCVSVRWIAEVAGRLVGKETQLQ